MKTLFALMTGAVVGTITALWLAARHERDHPTAAVATSEVVPEPASALETRKPEGASA